jgi:hypothetical protein
LNRISGRIAVEGAPAVEDLHLALREHPRELVATELASDGSLKGSGSDSCAGR